MKTRSTGSIYHICIGPVSRASNVLRRANGVFARACGRSPTRSAACSSSMLKLDRDCRRWITSTLDGPGRGNEVWTHAFPVGDRETHIVVDFFAPGLAADRASEVFNSSKALYTRLYDEDVEMMSGRQAQLDAIKTRAPEWSSSRRVLGPLDQVRMRLPMTIEERGRRFRIVETGWKIPRACHRMPAYAGAARHRDGDRRHHRMPVAWISNSTSRPASA